jgi:RHH-type transcriptional regulator, proline utilization regulon repressor / proline dehydrogenase / delta 1-pyrroline-5-carboxylate dehydrogenase
VQLDDHIRDLGREIFAKVRHAAARDGNAGIVDRWVMKLVMGNESLKAQLFRFVDVLPVLRTDQQISSLLREYLLEARQLPRVARWATEHLPVIGTLASPVAAAAKMQVRHMAGRFVAASDVQEAAKAIEELRKKRLAFTIDFLGEAVISEYEAEVYQQQYLSLLKDLPPRVALLPEDPLLDEDSRGPIPRVNVSIKLSSLFSQFDPIDPAGTRAAVLRRLRPILTLARQVGAFVNLDMEQRAFKQTTLEIFKSVLCEEEFRDWRDVGIAIQAYLKSTLGDLEELSKWARERGTPVWVRLVKGAYWDYETVMAAQNGWETPVFTDKAETDANFEACSAFLIEHREWLRPAIASHNIRSIAAAMAVAQQQNVDPRDLEFQMLYGMADAEKAALAAMGRRVRVYMPVGKLLPGMAYLIRRLLENTSNESFLRAGFVERLPEEQLLMNPLLQKRPPRAQARSAEFENTSATDFSLETSRKKMAEAIASAQSAIGARYPMLIGGEWISSQAWLESINPSHKSQNVGHCARATVQDAQRAVATASGAFDKWRQTAPEERAALLDRVGGILARDRFELAAWEVLECGKPWREADADVAEAIDYCHYYAWQMRLLSRHQGRDLPGEQNDWEYEPRGVAVIIAPWNFPLAILCGMTAAAVVTGNTAVIKPAEQSSVIGAKLAAAFAEAQAPPGVVNCLFGIGEEIGPTLVEHPQVAMIAFTGSKSVGLGINQQASVTPPGQHHVKRIIAEMGGKNAIIVDENADLDEAVAGVVASAFGYAGQKCSACSRAVVLEGVYDTFLNRLIEATRSLKVAPAEDPACAVGPVIDAEAFERIGKAIGRAKSESRLAYGSEAGSLANEGFFIAPHIFADVSRDSFLAQEEIFGPVLSVIKARDWSEGMQIATGVQYALTGGVYSRSPVNISRTRREFRVGNLYINRKTTGAIVGRQPFGGFKLSGTGTQAGGPDYLRHFMMPRCITENTLRRGFVPAESAPSE